MKAIHHDDDVVCRLTVAARILQELILDHPQGFLRKGMPFWRHPGRHNLNERLPAFG